MDKKFVVLVLVFFLVLGSFSMAVFYDQQNITRTKASSQCKPDASKSFIVSIPKEVAKGGSCEVDVFARCADESAATGSVVTLSVEGGFASPDTTQADEAGKATFSVTGAGLAKINAVINKDGQLLPLEQTVTCNFAQ